MMNSDQNGSNSKSPLHNFSLPYNLKWGYQRTLKCVNPPKNITTLHQETPKFEPQNTPKDTTFNANANNANGNCNGNGNDDSAKPWNLRTRRAACKAPLLKVEEKRNGFVNNNYNYDSPTRRVSQIDCSSSSPRKNFYNCVVDEKIKFSIPLSKDEIEQDFFRIARIRPPRRPKKRPRIVQKNLDSVFPGLWLSEITPDSYKVPDAPES